jgi:hypothetical protein
MKIPFHALSFVSQKQLEDHDVFQVMPELEPGVWLERWSTAISLLPGGGLTLFSPLFNQFSQLFAVTLCRSNHSYKGAKIPHHSLTLVHQVPRHLPLNLYSYSQSLTLYSYVSCLRDDNSSPITGRVSTRLQPKRRSWLLGTASPGALKIEFNGDAPVD